MIVFTVICIPPAPALFLPLPIQMSLWLLAIFPICFPVYCLYAPYSAHLSKPPTILHCSHTLPRPSAFSHCCIKIRQFPSFLHYMEMTQAKCSCDGLQHVQGRPSSENLAAKHWSNICQLRSFRGPSLAKFEWICLGMANRFAFDAILIAAKFKFHFLKSGGFRIFFFFFFWMHKNVLNMGRTMYIIS